MIVRISGEDVFELDESHHAKLDELDNAVVTAVDAGDEDGFHSSFEELLAFVRTEGNTAVGMFTERDVVRAIAEHGVAGVSMKVSQLISVQQLVSCTSADTLEHVRHLMSKHHIRHLPVIDNYSLIGVISIRDISTAFDDAAMAKSAAPAAA